MLAKESRGGGAVAVAGDGALCGGYCKSTCRECESRMTRSPPTACGPETHSMMLRMVQPKSCVAVGGPP
eukprot:scaffold7976_cov403-Prasinococcus_capsulatus_cf.AAC.3